MLRAAVALLAVCGSLCADSAADEKFIGSRRNWWAFQKVARPAVPGVSEHPVDAFLTEALRAKGLQFAPELGREALARRLSLDLTGLPPDPAEVERFVRDSGPGAVGRLIDRWMASPHYGERWAVKWLDVVRYSDTNGYEMDAERPHAWRYRDYVVRSFNANKPFDRFVREQIAGDELYPGDRDALIATGFNRVGPIHLVSGNTDPEENRQEVLNEMTGAVGSVFLGLTVGCARCHNHKFDPIPQADYYRLQAVFAATEGKDIEIATKEEKQARDEVMKALMEKVKPVQDEIKAMEKPYRDRLIEERKAKLEPQFLAALEVPEKDRNDEQKRLAKEAQAQIKPRWDEVLGIMPEDLLAKRRKLRQRLHELDYEEPPPVAEVFAVANMEKAPATHILKIGNHKMKLGEVGPGLLQVLDGGDVTAEAAGRRSRLAEWLTSAENPLVARVMVNRIWQLRMGTGLVATPNDFGVLGARPSNAKLLDWLAAEFVASGWDLKALDRLILTSAAYRQQVVNDARAAEADPDNKLYWRANRRRLEAELIRDSALKVAGTLNAAFGGRPIKAPIEPEIYDLIFTEGEPDNLWPVDRDRSQFLRRSLYLINKRTVRSPFMANFDQPDNMTSCPVRPASTHSLQALSLLNSDVMQEQSAALARRLESECGGGAECRIERAYRLALARAPKPEEVRMAKEFVAGGGPWQDFCLALLNRTEFVYVP